MLADVFPEWAEDAYTTYGRGKGQPIDLRQPGVLLEAMKQQQISRAVPRAKLARERNLGPLSNRLVESLEIRSADRSMIVIIDADERVVRPLGRASAWANGVALQLLRGRIGNHPAQVVAVDFLERCLTWSALAIGQAYRSEEYAAYNMDYSTGARAVGIDISRWIRGLYWANAFGQPYLDLMKLDDAVSIPGVNLKRGAEGILLQLADRPTAWKTDEYQRRRQLVLEALGRQFFFDRDHPDRPSCGIDISKFE